jgi:16S rRNA (uracil1498-N3)-methyltransferase
MTRKYKERRIYVDNTQVFNQMVFFSPDNIHYLRNVLHMRLGELLTVLDGSYVYEIVLELGTAGELVGRILSMRESVQTFPMTICLAFGCVRPGPTEEILRHGTELGVEQFFPLILELSNRKPEVTSSRWVKIAESACAQSGRLKKPRIHDPIGLSTFLKTCSSTSKLIHLAMEDEVPPLLKVLDSLSTDSVTFVIGPEGGITEQEQTILARWRSVPASLGFTTLRAETAAVVAVGMTMNWGLCRFVH